MFMLLRYVCDLCVCKYTIVHSISALFLILKGYSSAGLYRERAVKQIVLLLLDIYFPVEMCYSLSVSLCTRSMYKLTAVSLSETSSWQLSIINMQTWVEVKMCFAFVQTT